MAVNATGQRGPRRRRRSSLPLSRRRAVYDALTILLLFIAPLGGMVLFGGNRIWNVGPLSAMTLVAGVFFFLRFSLNPDLYRLCLPPGAIWFLAFFLYAGTHIFWGTVPFEARAEWVTIGSYLVAYLAWTDLTVRVKRWRPLLAIVFIAASLIAWYAIIQHARDLNMVLFRERPATYGMRASGTYICPNHLANLFEIVICMAAAVIFTRPAGLPLQLVAGYSLVVCLPVLIMTQSRSGLLATLAGLGVVALALAWQRNRKAFYWTLVALPLAAAALVAGIWFFFPAFQERILGMMPSHLEGSAAGRLAYWRDTLPMIADRPLTGHGAGSFRWLFEGYKTTSEQLWLRFAHNEYLHLLAEYGIAGFILLAGAFGSMVWAVGKQIFGPFGGKETGLMIGLAGALAASFTHALFDYNFHVFANVHVLLLFAGIVFASPYTAGQKSVRRVPRSGALGISAGGILLCLVCLGITVQVTGAYIRHQQGREALGELEQERALGFFDRSRHLDDSYWKAYIGIGDVYRQKSFWNLDRDQKDEQAQRALEAFAAAAERNPADMEPVLGAGKMYLLMGKTDEGLAHIRRAAEHARFHGAYQSQYGLKLRQAGRYEEALEQFRWAKTLMPTNEMVQLNLRILRKRVRGK